MSVLFKQLDMLGPNDLPVTLADENGVPFDPYYISYAFYRATKTRGIYRVGLGDRIPFRSSIGSYYAGETLSTEFLSGDYYIEWTIRRTDLSPKEIIGKKHFAVVQSNYSP